MKKLFSTITVFFSLLVLAQAQNTSPYWSLSGNSNATSTSKLGTTNANHLRLFTNNLERMRISASGNVGIGKTGPNAKLHLNSFTGQDALRVQVNSETKLFVHRDGGVAIGANETPPTNGLYVSGDAGFGTTFPLAKIHINSAAGQYPLRAQANGLTALMAHNNLGVSIGSAAIPPPNGLSVILGNSGFGTATPGDYKVKIVHGGLGLNLEQGSTGNDWELWTSTANNLNLYYNDSFRGNFSAETGAYSSSSDERVKTNIKAMPSVLQKVNQLKPTTYQFKAAQNTESSTPESYGFLAQDVMKIFPSLVTHHVVKERNLDTYTLDYSGFGVIAIKAIQELQQTNEELKQIIQQQQQEINAFKDRFAKLEAAIGSGKNDLNNLPNAELTGANLQQNHPNPFNQITTFHYSLPTGANAQILVYDTAGKLVKTLAAPTSGKVQMDARDLKPGTYVYSLLVDGKLAASKQMILSK